VSVALCSAQAAAQEPEPEPAPAKPPPKTDELVEQLLESEEGGGPGDDDDIEWLFSESEEYSPSGLVGEPVPAPALPERGEGSPRTWDPRWRRFELGNYILTGTALAIAIGSALIPESPDRWRGKNEVDESVRDGIGITNYSAGQWGRDGSDVALSVSVTFPLMVDSLIGLFWYRRSPDVAKQTALIATEAISVTAALQGLTSGFSSRERPYGRNCGASIDGELDHCVERRRYRSFFSGHTAMSFAAAGATCTNHYYHEVWGDGFADGLTCGLAFLTAGAAGTLRIVGDQHYASDVAIGAAVGTLSGLGIPWLLHYGPVARNEGSVKLKLAPVGHGVGMLGEF
jgi:membrane-associated phospholipid phosphatase